MKIAFYWSNIIGIGRSLIAIGTLLTIVFNPTEILFDFDILNQKSPLLQRYGLFFLFKDQLEIARLIAAIVLLTVIYGIHPKITGLLHWYVTYSFFTASNIIDGGDHIASVLTFLLIPITLFDSRNNHWNQPVYSSGTLKSTISNAFYWLIKIQVCVIYLHAFVGKLPVAEWLNGTAVYYWLTHEYFGVHEMLRPYFKFFLSNGFIVFTITWGVLLLEFLLSASILLDKGGKKRKIMLLCGIIFHFFILAIHGLFSFFFSITAGLILYLMDNSHSVNYKVLIYNLSKYGKRLNSFNRI